MKYSNPNIRLLTIILSTSLMASASVAHSSDCVVGNTLDSSFGLPPIPGSLRDCLTLVGPGDTVLFDSIIFDPAHSDSDTTINVLYQLPELDGGAINIDASDRRVTVNGSGAGNANGLIISSSGNQISGLSIVGFSGSGIWIAGGAANTIGGSRSTGSGPNGQGLRISACGAFGVEISGSGSTSNVVKGCWIGLDAGGFNPEPNLAGVAVSGGSSGNTIGGVVAGEANVISGNSFEGVTISGAGSDSNVIIGNVIGAGAIPDSLGNRQSAPNGSSGIFLSRGTNSTKLGGSSSSESNLIAFNGGSGVEVRSPSSRKNALRGNSIGRNQRGGITLFDGSNDGVRAPVIVSVQDLGPNGAGTGESLRLTGTTSHDGSLEVFSDSGSQGETFLTRKPVLSGAWTADVDVAQVGNLSATITDGSGNTSRFGAFALSGTGDDTDGDGFPDELETLANTEPIDPLDTPTLLGPLSVTKMGIKLSFASPGKDSLKATIKVVLPVGFTADGATLGVAIAGHSEQFVLDESGKGSSSSSTVALTTSIKNGSVVKLNTKLTTLTVDLAASGLTNTDTPADGDRWVLPVAVTLDDSVTFGTASVLYKATQGKSGKASK